MTIDLLTGGPSRTITVVRTHVGPDGEDWGSHTTEISAESPLGIILKGTAKVTLDLDSGGVQTYTKVSTA